ncbi:MAG: hypothetical protein CVV53_03855 [Spirochaetae bacterium HGW-Spirochaetae-9]|nr:MAG: hypothetical protein CVV53_03855 [Spirochaetae bacterium HGW-Spirochaetae-9]
MSIALRRFSDDAAWKGAILACFEEALKAAIDRGQKAFHASLAGGSTPEPVYRALAAAPSLAALSTDILIHLWVGDERDVEATSPLRNGRMIAGIFMEGPVSAAMRWNRSPVLHLWPKGDRIAACATYAREIEDTLGPNPEFDLAILGMGADGHTAGLFSLADVADSAANPARHATAPQTATPFTLSTVAPSEPRLRMTMGASLLKRSLVSMILVRGKGKAAILAAILKGGEFPLTAAVNSDAEFFYLEE